MVNFGINYLKKLELKFPTKKNTYMCCYQYTGTKMIQNFGSLYIACFVVVVFPQGVAYSTWPLCWSG